MHEGRVRKEVPYRWPDTLLLPARPPLLVYLDLNHWVSLAKAHHGHRDGSRFQDALDAIIRAQRDGHAVYPISDSTFFEMSKIRRYRQRRNLALRPLPWVSS